MFNNYDFELPEQFSRWHHLAAYDTKGDLLEISDWIDPVHAHGLPLDSVYVDPIRAFLKYNKKMPYSYIQLGPTNSCNLNCEGCYSSNCRDTNTLEFSQIENILKEIGANIDKEKKQTAMISFHGPGEPLCTKKTREIVLKSIHLCNKLGLVCRICTNATFNDENFLDELIKSPNLKLIWVSMKAGTKETYKRYTKTDKFDQSRENMKTMAALRKKYNRNDLTLKSSTEISKYSISETLDAALFSKDIGFNIFKPALHSVDFQNVYINETDKVVELRKSLMNLYDDNFNSLFWEIPKRCSKNYHSDKLPSKFCFQAETRLYADGKGRLYPCIHWLDNAFDEYDFGNIDDFRYSNNLNSISNFNLNGQSMKLKSCSICSDPWVNYFHQWIKDVLEKDINASFTKIFDNEINKKFPSLKNSNVLNGYDPREKCYD